MRICLDTNAYSAFKRNHSKVVSLIEEADQIIVPCIVLGELYGGFFRGTKTQQNISELEDFLKLPGVVEFQVDLCVAERYGILFKSLFKAGTPIPTNDIWIAAIALESSSRLLSADHHFDRIPTLIQIKF